MSFVLIFVIIKNYPVTRVWLVTIYVMTILDTISYVDNKALKMILMIINSNRVFDYDWGWVFFT
jgi:hypothetical protein